MTPEVHRHCLKPQGLIGMVREEGHRYEICLRTWRDIFTDNRDGVYGQKGHLKDNKDGVYG